MENNRIKETLVMSLVVLMVVSFCVLPFIWQVITSLKPAHELTDFRRILPSKITFEHYKNVFSGRPFEKYIYNSVIVAGVTTLCCIILGSFSSYALANMQLRGKKGFLAMTLIISMFPQIAIVTSLYAMFVKGHLINTYTGLILAYIALNLPLSIWILTNFFKQIPYDLIEAAKIDGCSPFNTLVEVIMPLALPGIFTAAILIFINAWNEFLFALTFTSDISRQTVPVGIAMLPTMFHVPWGDMAAASIIVTIPLIVLVFFFQRRIIQGLTAGAVKG